MANNQLNAFSNLPQSSINLPHSPNTAIPPAVPNLDNELLALADIHLPAQVSWWPPAPGWWIIIVIILLFIYSGSKFIQKKLHQAKYKKQAREELQKISRFWQKQQNLIATASHLSSLIRRIALANNKGLNNKLANVASLTDQQWLLYLEQQPGLKNISKQYHDILLQLPYQDPMIHFDRSEQQQLAKKMDGLLSNITIWIKKGFKHV